MYLNIGYQGVMETCQGGCTTTTRKWRMGLLTTTWMCSWADNYLVVIAAVVVDSWLLLLWLVVCICLALATLRAWQRVLLVSVLKCFHNIFFEGVRQDLSSV